MMENYPIVARLRPVFRPWSSEASVNRQITV